MNCRGKVDIKVDFYQITYVIKCKMFAKIPNKEMEQIDRAYDQLMNYTNHQNKESVIFSLIKTLKTLILKDN
ncbi:MAG: hypothetical protein ACQBVK_01650 [Candidatus Phytoplasma sp. TWB_XP]